MIRFTAASGDSSHNVLIGPLGDAAAEIRALTGNRRVPLVTDPRLLDLYGARLNALVAIEPVLVPEGEAAKDWAPLRRLIERFAEIGVSRTTPVIALGGGSVGDVTGLAAALFKRGCPVIHVPTTLLAQADSALGGKTAIDALGQKNLVGAFHPPALVVADPAFLGTLDERQLRSGYAEVVKYGLIDDSAFFAWCEANGASLLAGDGGARLRAIEHCLRAKARFVADDLRDLAGQRALLNLGHSFGHAIESLSGFGAILHGEAVAVGLCLAFRYSAQIGLCAATDAERVRYHLAAGGLPTSLRAVGLDGRGGELLQLMRQDKKSLGGALSLVLVRGVGQAFLERAVDAAALQRFLAAA